MKVLAELLRPVEAETPYGGRSTTYEVLGVIWLEPSARRRRERTDGGVTRRVEAMTGTARADPRLVEDRVLRFGGADWAIVAVEGEPRRPGRVSLGLERGR